MFPRSSAKHPLKPAAAGRLKVASHREYGTLGYPRRARPGGLGASKGGVVLAGEALSSSFQGGVGFGVGEGTVVDAEMEGEGEADAVLRQRAAAVDVEQAYLADQLRGAVHDRAADRLRRG